jgi:O-antigen/teichoic acid export membrane protein
VSSLRDKTIRGGIARLGAQAANFLLRVGSLVVLARLLRPDEFGLVGMVTAFTGVLNLFRDFGLSSAAIQRGSVTPAQSSTLFWINMVVGLVLGLLTVVMAPAMAAFYHEPRLVPVTAVIATAFVFNAAGVQHNALLQRELRFSALAGINTVSLVLSTAIGIGAAAAGFGYWSLVYMTITLPLLNTIGCWLMTSWVPGRPERQVGMRSMMNFGGTVTLNGLVYYLACNADKVLLGRVWGVAALGVYGRGYQLISIPTDNLNYTVGEVAFSALSRLQDDPGRLKTYFLKGYSLILAATLPLTIACAIFSDDVVAVLLGSKWTAVAPIFRALAPTILVFAIVNPLGWFMTSLGLVRRGLNMALTIAPFMIGAYLIGLRYGPIGVAIAYSSVMLLWVWPAVSWAVHGTMVSTLDVFRAVRGPLVSSVVAGIVAVAVRSTLGQLPPLPRLILECTVLLVVFAGMLLFAMGQKALYLGLLRGSQSSPGAVPSPTTATEAL